MADSDDQTRRITRVHSGRIPPLSRCRRDKALLPPIDA